MSRAETARARQVCMFVFLSLAVDMAVRSFTRRATSGAQVEVLAALLDTAAALALLSPILTRACAVPDGPSAGTKIWRGAAAILFAAAAASSVARSEAFFRYVSDEPIPQAITCGIFVLAVFYALRCGPEGILRASGLSCAAFLASMALLFVSNWDSMHFFNLTITPFDADKILETAIKGFALHPEILLFCILAAGSSGRKSRPLYRTLMLLCAFYIALSVCAQAVLGDRVQLQVQTIHTLSRLGSLSVFRRLDALHIAAWMLAELCKAAGLACGAQTVLAPLLPRQWGESAPAKFAAGLLVLMLVICAGIPAYALQMAFTVGTGALLVAMAFGKREAKAAHAEKHV